MRPRDSLFPVHVSQLDFLGCFLSAFGKQGSRRDKRDKDNSDCSNDVSHVFSFGFGFDFSASGNRLRRPSFMSVHNKTIGVKAYCRDKSDYYEDTDKYQPYTSIRTDEEL